MVVAGVKDGPEAGGCTRAWGCICPSPSAPVTMCPYHTAQDHINRVDEKFLGKSDTDYSDMPDLCTDDDVWIDEPPGEDDIPLFPDERGNTVTAAAMMNPVDAIAEKPG